MSYLRIFRNLCAYRLTQHVPLLQAGGILGSDLAPLKGLALALATHRIAEPAVGQTMTSGFAPVIDARGLKTQADLEEPELEEELDEDAPDEGADLLEVVANRFLVMRYVELEREVSGAGIRRALNQRIAEIERVQQRKVYKKERDQLRDETKAAFLPYALIKERSMYAIVDTQTNRVFITSTTFKRAENLLSTLRACLGSLPVRPIRSAMLPRTAYTQWIRDEKAPKPLILVDFALMEGEDSAKVGFAHVDLASEEVRLNVLAGRFVTKLFLGVTDDDGQILAAAMMDDSLQLRRVYFGSHLSMDVDDRSSGVEDPQAAHRAALQASILLGGDTVNKLLDQVLDHCGGDEFKGDL